MIKITELLNHFHDGISWAEDLLQKKAGMDDKATSRWKNGMYHVFWNIIQEKEHRARQPFIYLVVALLLVIIVMLMVILSIYIGH